MQNSFSRVCATAPWVRPRARKETARSECQWAEGRHGSAANERKAYSGHSPSFVGTPEQLMVASGVSAHVLDIVTGTIPVYSLVRRWSATLG